MRERWFSQCVLTWTPGGTRGYTDLLDSSGTFFAVAKVAGLTDSRGNLPLARQNMAYLADALAMMAGGWLKPDLESRH